MAAFIVAVRGTTAQATLLGVSAAVGHTIIVWGLALLGLYLGDKLILDKAEPWLMLLSGLLIVLLAARLLWMVRRESAEHDAGHDHDHGHLYSDDHADAHAAAHARDLEARFAGRRNVSSWEVAWFGFAGGLLPCPAAIAVLLVCLQLKAFVLGIGMVLAFSLGLAITLVGVGVLAAWGTRRASAWSGFDTWAARVPYFSGTLVMILGMVFVARGLMALSIAGTI